MRKIQITSELRSNVIEKGKIEGTAEFILKQESDENLKTSRAIIQQCLEFISPDANITHIYRKEDPALNDVILVIAFEEDIILHKN